jgi:FixJ family two-component response regulator
LQFQTTNLSRLPDNDSSAICLLDDHPSVLKGLVRLLSSAGLKAEPFSDPNKFLDYERTHHSPVAIIDIWMPMMNGFEVQSQLRDISPSTRVIVLTANDDPSLRAAALNAGASAFLTKPCNYEKFLATVLRALAAA